MNSPSSSLQRYIHFLKAVQATRKTILVVGDAIEDTYVECAISRIAPEGEAPVLDVLNQWVIPGGAANVLEQLRSWHCIALMISGKNKHTKTRYLVNGRLHAVVSKDDEGDDFGQIPVNIVDDGLRTNSLDAIICADYGKGAITPQIARMVCEHGKKRNIPVVVDPSPNPFSDQDRRWEGATVMKMNMNQWLRRAPTARREWLDARRIDSLVVTKGATPPDITDAVFHVPSDGYHSCENRPMRHAVVDCAGAGDHFSAVLALGLCHGLSVAGAAEFAHESSRLRVAYRRPRPILPREVCGMFDPPMGKMLTAADINQITTPSTRIVFTNGVFSMLHAGHSSMLDYAKSLGDILVVGVNTDESAARVKGTPPLMPLEQRMRLLASQSSVDYVVPFSEDTPEELMKSLRPISTLVKGEDNRSKSVPGAHIAMAAVAFAPQVFPQHCKDWFTKATECI